ncbi:MAG: VWA domain-containing protein [Armatimonadetes bacterium]|nr:VWA domain-containing protein [Armatimonadota bacterium]
MAGLNALEAVEFAENMEQRCPCVLLLDTSGSMAGDKINALNEGLKAFKDHLSKDTLAGRRVEVAVVTFNTHVEVVTDFTTVEEFVPPTLTASGLTHMGSAIHKALDMVQERKATYKQYGVSYYRPWVFMITDGQPEGEPEGVMAQAATRIHGDEQGKRVAFFAVGVEGANMQRLSEVAFRQPVKLAGLSFAEMFVWLSASMQKVTQANPDDQIALPPAGWGAV